MNNTQTSEKKGVSAVKIILLSVVILLAAAAVTTSVLYSRYCKLEDGAMVVNLSGCGYGDERINKLREKYPDVVFEWDVKIGNRTIVGDTTALELSDSDGASAEQLVAAAPALPQITSLKLSGMALSVDQYEAVRTAYPNAAVEWTVPTAGGIPHDADSASLSDMADFRELVGMLGYLPRMRRVDMTAAQITLEDSEYLANLCTVLQLDVIWTVSVFGQSMRSDTTTLELSGEGITDLSELRYLPRLSSVSISSIATGDLSPLCSVKSLIAIRVSDVAISDFSVLQSMTWLKSVVLHNTGVTRAQAAALENAVSGCIVMFV